MFLGGTHGYNVIKDGDFEQPKPNPWEEYARSNRQKADSYYYEGEERGHVGRTLAMDSDGSGRRQWAVLTQEIKRRVVKELDSIRWYFKWEPDEDGLNYFCINLISHHKDTLSYIYLGQGTPLHPLPKEHQKRKLIELDERESYAWHREDRNFKEDWIGEGFAEEDTMVIINLWANVAPGPPSTLGEQVFWDDVELHSQRFDHDAACLSIDSKRPEKNKTYTPIAHIQNKGAYKETIDAVFNIYDKEGKTIYTDTIKNLVLKIDEIKQLSFRDWNATAEEVKLEAKTLLLEDENPENDRKIVSYIGIEEISQGQKEEAIKIYSCDGRMVGKGSNLFNSLKPGIYFIKQKGGIKKYVKLE